MKKKRKPLCLIPARGGSKRFPRKNIALLAEIPLVAWTIKAALSSGIFDHAWVSSEDREILKTAKEWGASPLKRPSELAGDLTSLEMVCKEVLSQLAEKGLEYTDIFVMLPTSPFRKPENILSAWNIFSASEADSLMSVIQYAHPPQWAMFIDEGKWLLPRDRQGYDMERQLLTPLYHHDGAYFISSISKFLETGHLLGPRTMPITVSSMESVDIDTPLDLLWAEFLLQREKSEASRATVKYDPLEK